MKDDWKKQVWEKEQMKSGKDGGENMSKVDWSEAPLAAQFYSGGRFRKHKGGKEFFWINNEWKMDDWLDSLKLHKKLEDFEMRPEVKVLNTEEQIQNIKEAHAHLNKLMDTLLSSLPTNKP